MASVFYNERAIKSRYLVPSNCNDSDFEVEDESVEDTLNNDADPDFILEVPDDFKSRESESVSLFRPQQMPEEPSDSEDLQEPEPHR